MPGPSHLVRRAAAPIPIAMSLMQLAACRLGVQVLADQRAALLAAVFFALNPATIFHAAPYTEACFTLLSLLVPYMLLCHGSLAAATAVAALSSATRSNGEAELELHVCIKGGSGMKARLLPVMHHAAVETGQTICCARPGRHRPFICDSASAVQVKHFSCASVLWLLT